MFRSSSVSDGAADSSSDFGLDSELGSGLGDASSGLGSGLGAETSGLSSGLGGENSGLASGLGSELGAEISCVSSLGSLSVGDMSEDIFANLLAPKWLRNLRVQFLIFKS